MFSQNNQDHWTTGQFSTDNKQGGTNNGFSGDAQKAQNPLANKFFNKNRKPSP
jgi:hypothetical protein